MIKRLKRHGRAYYKVKLTDSDMDVEVTATQRTAYYVCTYNSDAPCTNVVGYAKWSRV